MADISKITLPSNDEYNIKDATARQDIAGKQDKITASGILKGNGSGDVSAATAGTDYARPTDSMQAYGIPFAIVNSTSTATAFTATVPEISELKDGVCVLLKNGVVTSASGFTININGLGAKPVYNNLAAASAETTIFNTAYTMLFVYDSTRVEGGCWICYRGYDSNTNTIGYQLRTNSALRVAADTGYRYRLWFQTLDGKWAPANKSTSTNATASRTPNNRVIDPFGEIVYNATNGTTSAGANLSATTCWQQYTLSLGYSFNSTGAALTLTNPAPVYVKCTPQSGGGVTMDGYVQALPSTADGKVYIFLGMAYSATNIELFPNHPVYYYSNGAIRQWTNSEPAPPAVTVADNGKVLMVVNGAWEAVSGEGTSLPSQSEHSGEFLTTNGTSASWAAAPVTSVNSKTGAVSLSASDVNAVATSAVGANSGVAPLNASGKIDSTYLPSYVDDVIEGYYYNSKFYTTSAHTIEITGETGKIFVDLSTNKTYRYGGSSFTEISQGSVVSVSRDLTSGTKIGTLTINGTGTDLYAPTPESFTVTGGASTIVSDNLTANRALISNTNGKVAVSDVTSTELGYLDGVTSAIQTQIDGKQAKVTASGILEGDGNGNVSAADTLSTSLLQIDNTPASGSNHLVTSGGIYDKILARTKIYTASCSTAAGTAAKIATLDDSSGFSLTAGVTVAVRFTYGNSATTPTLRVDGSTTGTAKTIAVPSSTTAFTTGNGTTYNTWGAYETISFTYNGTYWVNTGSALLEYLAYNKANSIVVPSAADAAPLMDSTATVGTSTDYAREDHIHPTDTSRAPNNHATTATTYGVGNASNYGHVKLSDSTSSTSSTSDGIAATPAAVKAAYDKANNAVPKTVSSNPGTSTISHTWDGFSISITTSIDGNNSFAVNSDSTEIHNVVTPTANGDAVPKSYVDNAISNIDALPSQTDNSGKFLTTNGSVASWATILIPSTVANATTGISISDHSTTSIYGVQSSTTTASKASGANGTAPTLGTPISIPNVTSTGSGSFSATVTNHVLSFSHAHTAPTLGTAISVPNVTDAGSASTWSFSDVTVPIKNSSSTIVVTGKTHTITDNGHTHTLN